MLLARCVAGKNGASPEGRKGSNCQAVRSGKCPRLAHHRSRHGRRDHLAATLAAGCRAATGFTGRSAARGTGRWPTGGHLGLLPPIETAASLKLHKRRPPAIVVAEAAAAARGGRQAADHQGEQNRTRHLRFSTGGRAGSVLPWTCHASSVTTLENPTSRSGARSAEENYSNSPPGHLAPQAGRL